MVGAGIDELVAELLGGVDGRRPRGLEIGEAGPFRRHHQLEAGNLWRRPALRGRWPARPPHSGSCLPFSSKRLLWYCSLTAFMFSVSSGIVRGRRRGLLLTRCRWRGRRQHAAAVHGWPARSPGAARRRPAACRGPRSGSGRRCWRSPRPFRMVPSRNSARTTPTMRPRPPLMSMPPSTTAVTTNRIEPSALSPRAEPYWPIQTERRDDRTGRRRWRRR